MSRLALLSVLMLAGCASSLEARFDTPVAPGDNVLAQRIERAPPRSERAVLVAVTQAPVRLVAYDLEKSTLLWQQPVEAQSAPLIAGNTVVVQEAAGVVVRDLATGQVRVTLDEPGRLISADGVGNLVAISIGEGQGASKGMVALVDGDSVRFRRRLGQPVGSVALVGEYVLVPWASQRLTLLSASDGSELTRWHFPSQSIGLARVAGESVYIGQHALIRVTGDLPDRRESPPEGYAPQKRVLPGQPPALRDGYAPLAPLDSAEQRIALSFQLAEGAGEPHAQHDLLVLRFYRMVFGLAASADDARWVQVFERDQVGAQVSGAGLWLVDDAGSVRLLDPSGSELMRRELGMPVRAATIRGLRVAPAVAPSAERASAALSTLHDQLLAAALVSDDRLVLARAYAVEQLAHSQDPQVTGELISLCSVREAPEPVRLAACQRLAAREQGKTEVLAALRTRGSFLEDTSAPPVGPLAQAAARMGLVEAAPLLVAHAENPGTKVSDLPAIFQALEQLDHRAAAPTLERFVRLHHGEPQGSELSPAITAAISALGALRARAARATLEDVARDELGTKSVREEAQKALAVIDTPPGTKADAAEKSAKAAAAEEEAKVQVDPRPYALSSESVRQTLAPSEAALVRCLSEDPAQPVSARIAMIVAGSGGVEGLLVTPTTLQGCMEPVLRKVTFPGTRLGRQHISHTVLVASPKVAPVNAAPASAAPAKPAPAKVAPAKPAPAAAAPAKPAASEKP